MAADSLAWAVSALVISVDSAGAPSALALLDLEDSPGLVPFRFERIDLRSGIIASLDLGSLSLAQPFPMPTMIATGVSGRQSAGVGPTLATTERSCALLLQWQISVAPCH